MSFNVKYFYGQLRIATVKKYVWYSWYLYGMNRGKHKSYVLLLIK